jgi:hypothetical protein
MTSLSRPRGRAISATNQVSGPTHGGIVQAGSVGTVHIHQRAEAINVFFGPVDATGARFGSDPEQPQHADEVVE